MRSCHAHRPSIPLAETTGAAGAIRARITGNEAGADTANTRAERWISA
jgi:hypothetical protein